VSHDNIILYNIYYNIRRYTKENSFNVAVFIKYLFFSFFLYQNVHVTEIPACIILYIIHIYIRIYIRQVRMIRWIF